MNIFRRIAHPSTPPSPNAILQPFRFVWWWWIPLSTMGGIILLSIASILMPDIQPFEYGLPVGSLMITGVALNLGYPKTHWITNHVFCLTLVCIGLLISIVIVTLFPGLIDPTMKL